MRPAAHLASRLHARRCLAACALPSSHAARAVWRARHACVLKVCLRQVEPAQQGVQEGPGWHVGQGNLHAAGGLVEHGLVSQPAHKMAGGCLQADLRHSMGPRKRLAGPRYERWAWRVRHEGWQRQRPCAGRSQAEGVLGGPTAERGALAPPSARSSAGQAAQRTARCACRVAPSSAFTLASHILPCCCCSHSPRRSASAGGGGPFGRQYSARPTCRPGSLGLRRQGSLGLGQAETRDSHMQRIALGSGCAGCTVPEVRLLTSAQAPRDLHIPQSWPLLGRLLHPASAAKSHESSTANIATGPAEAAVGFPACVALAVHASLSKPYRSDLVLVIRAREHNLAVWPLCKPQSRHSVSGRRL